MAFLREILLFIQGFLTDIVILTENIDGVSVFICFCLTFIFLLFIEKNTLNVKLFLFILVTSIYFSFLLTVTLLGRYPNKSSGINLLFMTYKLAFMGSEAAWLDILYNIVLYIPIGIVLLHYKCLKLRIVTLLLIPLSIEFIQLLTMRGLFEISDIINNCIGGLLGSLLAWILLKIYSFILF